MALVKCANCKYYNNLNKECRRYPPRLKVRLDENFELEEYNLYTEIIDPDTVRCGEGTVEA